MKKIYLDNACSSIYDNKVLDIAKEYTDLYRNSEKSASDITRALRGAMKNARQAVANLIHCVPEEVALVESTSHALGIIADTIPLTKDDNVLICDLEYQASTIAFKRKQDLIGFEVRCVKTKNNEITAEDFSKYIDEHTKAIVIASVQEINGYRADIKAISKLARKHNIYLAVDGIQEVGAMTVNVEDLDVDFYCAGGKKWIGNPFGMGFLYINKRLIDKLEPNFYSYFNIIVPKEFGDYINYLENPIRHPFDKYTIVNDASKFEIGGYANYIGAFGLRKAIEVLLEHDPVKIEKHIKMLNKHYYKGLESLGIHPCSSKEYKHMSSIVSFNFGFKNNNIDKERKLVKFLQENNIYVSLRSSTGTGGIRCSMHYYNTIEEIDVLLVKLKEFIEANHIS